jgi:flagellar protein FlaG
MADELVPIRQQAPVEPAKKAAPSGADAGRAPTTNALEPDRPSMAERSGHSAADQEKKLADAVARLNEQVQRNGRGLAFAVDERLNREVITVTSTSTGEIVRQIPSESALKMAHAIEDAKGMLVDERV